MCKLTVAYAGGEPSAGCSARVARSSRLRLPKGDDG